MDASPVRIAASDKLPAIDSTARNGANSVARRRFQRGSTFLNKTKTMWLGGFAEYVLDSHGIEQRIRRQVVLCPVKSGDVVMRKRDAQKLLQPYIDRVNTSLAAPARARKNVTLDVFIAIWQRDYLSLCKLSTQSGTGCHLKRLSASFGPKDMRQIDAGDIQRLIAKMDAEGLDPKTIRNLWGVVSLLWQAALSQRYVDSALPKPKLPRRPKTKPRFFILTDTARIIAASKGEHRVFYWLAAESGLRAGELAGLRLTDIAGDCLTVKRSVWNGQEQTPKTDNAVRNVALSPQLVTLLWEQIGRQKAKGHEYLFSASTGSPWDMNVYRKRKMRKLLTSLGIESAGFHALRHFNVSLLDSLRVPLKVIQERVGHALTGSFTLDVYGHGDWNGNVEAARLAGDTLAQAVEKTANSDSLTTVQQKGLSTVNAQAIAN
jgi:integrase